MLTGSYQRHYLPYIEGMLACGRISLRDVTCYIKKVRSLMDRSLATILTIPGRFSLHHASTGHRRTHRTRIPTMTQPYPCRHTCGCTYTSTKKHDRDKHEGTGRRHRNCTTECPKHAGVTPNILVQTSDDYRTNLDTKSTTSSLRSTSRASSISRKRSREPTPDEPNKRSRDPTPDGRLPNATPKEDPEEALKHKKAERMKVIQALKIYCVLDPTRTEKSRAKTEGDVCWVDVKVGEEGARKLTKSGELKGYVFRDPVNRDTVRMYDWVSDGPANIYPTSDVKKPRHTLATRLSGKPDTQSCSRLGRSSENSLLETPRFGQRKSSGSQVLTAS